MYVSLDNPDSGPWTKIVDDTFPNPIPLDCDTMPNATFAIADVPARYLKFVADSYYPGLNGAGLKYFGFKATG